MMATAVPQDDKNHEERQGENHKRYYDKGHKDYHNWDSNETARTSATDRASPEAFFRPAKHGAADRLLELAPQ
jgi:hypothetical protein